MKELETLITNRKEDGTIELNENALLKILLRNSITDGGSYLKDPASTLFPLLSSEASSLVFKFILINLYDVVNKNSIKSMLNYFAKRELRILGIKTLKSVIETDLNDSNLIGSIPYSKLLFPKFVSITKFTEDDVLNNFEILEKVHTSLPIEILDLPSVQLLFQIGGMDEEEKMLSRKLPNSQINPKEYPVQLVEKYFNKFNWGEICSEKEIQFSDDFVEKHFPELFLNGYLNYHKVSASRATIAMQREIMKSFNSAIDDEIGYYGLFFVMTGCLFQDWIKDRKNRDRDFVNFINDKSNKLSIIESLNLSMNNYINKNKNGEFSAHIQNLQKIKGIVDQMNGKTVTFKHLNDEIVPLLIFKPEEFLVYFLKAYRK